MCQIWSSVSAAAQSGVSNSGSSSCDSSTECPTDGNTLMCRDSPVPALPATKPRKASPPSNLWDSLGSCLAVCLHTHQAECCSGCQNEKEPQAARPISSDPSRAAFCPSWCAEPRARGWHWNRMRIQGKFFS